MSPKGSYQAECLLKNLGYKEHKASTSFCGVYNFARALQIKIACLCTALRETMNGKNPIFREGEE